MAHILFATLQKSKGRRKEEKVQSTQILASKAPLLDLAPPPGFSSILPTANPAPIAASTGAAGSSKKGKRQKKAEHLSAGLEGSKTQSKLPSHSAAGRHFNCITARERHSIPLARANFHLDIATSRDLIWPTADFERFMVSSMVI